MKFAEKTIKLEKLIEAKSDLETVIRMNIIKKNNLLFINISKTKLNFK